jgi:anti-sigma regulatory factor (Ser/Thr protein kinase)
MKYRALVLSPGVESPSVARSEVFHWLQDVGMEELAERVLLIASELVANAAVHARTTLELSMVTDCRSVKLGVRDDDRHLPRLDGAAGEAHKDGVGVPLIEGGRGLSIVEGLADEWGIDVLQGGKRIWARVSLPQRSAR